MHFKHRVRPEVQTTFLGHTSDILDWERQYFAVSAGLKANLLLPLDYFVKVFGPVIDSKYAR